MSLSSQIRSFHKSLALFTVLVFGWTQIATAVPVIQEPTYLNPSLIPSKLVVPEALGSIEEVYESKGDQLVVFIQDAHTNYSAQKNIASIINKLIAEHDISLVGEEGAQGKIDTTLLRAFPIKEATEHVMDLSLRDGEINGPEYLAITGEENFDLVGIDKRELYLKNLSQFLAVLDIRESGTRFVRSTRTAMKNLQGAVYSKAHKELGELLNRHQNQQIDLVTFLGSLQKTAEALDEDMTPYHHLVRVLELVYKQQEHEAEAEDEEMKSAMKEIDAERLFLDIENLTYALKAHLAETPLERKLVALEEYLLLLERGFNLELSRKDAKRLEALHKTFRHEHIRQFLTEQSRDHRLKLSLNRSFEVPLDTYYEQIRSFYRTAAKRDGTLAGRLRDEMRIKNKDVAILVAGGFHKEGITKQLRQAGISYAVILPHISEINSHEKYLRVMEEHRSLLSLPERNTLAAASHLDFWNRSAFLTAKLSAIFRYSLANNLPIRGMDDPSLRFQDDRITPLPQAELVGTDDDFVLTVERWNRRYPASGDYTNSELRSGLASAARGTLVHLPSEYPSSTNVLNGIPSPDELRALTEIALDGVTAKAGFGNAAGQEPTFKRYFRYAIRGLSTAVVFAAAAWLSISFGNRVDEKLKEQNRSFLQAISNRFGPGEFIGKNPFGYEYAHTANLYHTPGDFERDWIIVKRGTVERGDDIELAIPVMEARRPGFVDGIQPESQGDYWGDQLSIGASEKNWNPPDADVVYYPAQDSTDQRLLSDNPIRQRLDFGDFIIFYLSTEDPAHDLVLIRYKLDMGKFTKKTDSGWNYAPVTQATGSVAVARIQVPKLPSGDVAPLSVRDNKLWDRTNTLFDFSQAVLEPLKTSELMKSNAGFGALEDAARHFMEGPYFETFLYVLGVGFVASSVFAGLAHGIISVRHSKLMVKAQYATNPLSLKLTQDTPESDIELILYAWNFHETPLDITLKSDAKGKLPNDYGPYYIRKIIRDDRQGFRDMIPELRGTVRKTFSIVVADSLGVERNLSTLSVKTDIQVISPAPSAKEQQLFRAIQQLMNKAGQNPFSSSPGPTYRFSHASEGQEAHVQFLTYGTLHYEQFNKLLAQARELGLEATQYPQEIDPKRDRATPVTYSVYFPDQAFQALTAYLLNYGYDSTGFGASFPQGRRTLVAGLFGTVLANSATIAGSPEIRSAEPPIPQATTPMTDVPTKVMQRSLVDPFGRAPFHDAIAVSGAEAGKLAVLFGASPASPMHSGVSVLDAKTGDLLHERYVRLTPTEYLADVVISGDGKTLAVVTSTRIIIINDENGQEVQSFETGNVNRVALSDDGKKVVGISGHNLYVWNVETGARKQTLYFGGFNGPNLYDIDVNQDGSQLAVVTEDRQVVIASISEDGKISQTVTLDHTPLLEIPFWKRLFYYDIKGIAFSPDGGTVVTYSKKHVFVWRISSGQGSLIQTIPLDAVTSTIRSGGWINDAALMPDGSGATFLIDHTISRWVFPPPPKKEASPPAGFGAKVRLGQLSAAIPWLSSEKGLFPQLLALHFSTALRFQEHLRLIDALRVQLYSELLGKIHDDSIELIKKRLGWLINDLMFIQSNDIASRSRAQENALGVRDRHLQRLLQLKVRLPAGFGASDGTESVAAFLSNLQFSDIQRVRQEAIHITEASPIGREAARIRRHPIIVGSFFTASVVGLSYIAMALIPDVVNIRGPVAFFVAEHIAAAALGLLYFWPSRKSTRWGYWTERFLDSDQLAVLHKAARQQNEIVMSRIEGLWQEIQSDADLEGKTAVLHALLRMVNVTEGIAKTNAVYGTDGLMGELDSMRRLIVSERVRNQHSVEPAGFGAEFKVGGVNMTASIRALKTIKYGKEEPQEVSIEELGKRSGLEDQFLEELANLNDSVLRAGLTHRMLAAPFFEAMKIGDGTFEFNGIKFKVTHHIIMGFTGQGNPYTPFGDGDYSHFSLERLDTGEQIFFNGFTSYQIYNFGYYRQHRAMMPSVLLKPAQLIEMFYPKTALVNDLVERFTKHEPMTEEDKGKSIWKVVRVGELAKEYGVNAEDLEQFLFSTEAFVHEPADGITIEGLRPEESYPQPGIVLFNAKGPSDAYTKRLRDFAEAGRIWATSSAMTPEVLSDLLESSEAAEGAEGAHELKIRQNKSVWFDPEFVYELRIQLIAGIRALGMAYARNVGLVVDGVSSESLSKVKEFPVSTGQSDFIAAIGAKLGVWKTSPDAEKIASGDTGLPKLNLTDYGKRVLVAVRGFGAESSVLDRRVQMGVIEADTEIGSLETTHSKESVVSISPDLGETGPERMMRIVRETQEEKVETEIVAAMEDVVANAAQKSQEQIDALPTRVFRSIEELREFKASLASLLPKDRARMVEPVGTVMFLNEVSEEIEDDVKLEIAEVFPNVRQVYVRGVAKHLPFLNGSQAALLGELLDEETERFLLFVDRRTLDAMQANGNAVREAIYLRILAERVTSIAA